MAKVLVLASFANSLTCFRGHLLKALVQGGHEVTACAPGAPDEVGAELAAMGVCCRDIPMDRNGTSMLKDMRTLLVLGRLCREEKPDLLLPYTIKPVIYGSLAGGFAGTPRIASMITGLGYAFSDGQRHSLTNRLVRALYRLAFRFNQVVFFQNPDDLQLFSELGLLGKNTRPVLINGSGVDLHHYSPASHPRAISFLLITRLIGQKGVREYAAAAQTLRQRYPQAKFRLAGWIDDSPDAIAKAELEQWIDEGVIDYLGVLEDIRPAMADASVFVLPSYYREGTPRITLEALAMGRAVVSTDAPGCRETVRPGWNGFLVPVRSVSALTAAMERFLLETQLVTTMGAASRRLAEEKYNVHLVNRIILENLGLPAVPPVPVATAPPLGEGDNTSLSPSLREWAP